jgi:hypothetical protein
MNALPRPNSDEYSRTDNSAQLLHRHPQDPDVLIGKVPISKAFEIIKCRRAKAVIIPFRQKERLKAYGESLTQKDWENLPEKTIIHRGGGKLHAPKLHLIPSWIRDEISETFNLISGASPRKSTQLHLLANKPGSGTEGFAPYIHNHLSADIHLTLFGAAIEWTRINVALSGMSQRQILLYPYMEETIIRGEIGDTFVFGPDFWHRSSIGIPTQGRISIMKPELFYMK